MPRPPVKQGRRRLRRWAPGERVSSASRLNQVIDAVTEMRETLGVNQAGRTAPVAVFRNIYIQDLAGGATGQVLGEWTSGGADSVEVYLVPDLYIATGYTYTNNNERNHTSSATDEELVPPLEVGNVLRVEFMYHPTTGVLGWHDCNRAARNWGEVVV